MYCSRISILYLFVVFHILVALEQNEHESQIFEAVDTPTTNDYTSHVRAVLEALRSAKSTNAATIRIYDYKDAFVVNGKQKGQVTELTLRVLVKCLEDRPLGVPCSDNSPLICNTYVLDGVQVLNDVQCTPEVEPFSAEMGELPPTGAANGVYGVEATSFESGEHFVAVREPTNASCVGCEHDISTNAKGVDELARIALKHLESNADGHAHNLKQILKVSRQIVAGVKYILIAEIENEINEVQVCRVEFIQKPWISRDKHIIRNNCTVSQEFSIDGGDDGDNEIINHTSQLSKHQLHELEQQIVHFSTPSAPKVASSSSFEDTQATEDRPQHSDNTEADLIEPTQTSSVPSLRRRRSNNRRLVVGGSRPIDVDSPDIQPYILAAINHLDSHSDTQNRYKAIETSSATSQVVAGILYKINVSISQTECLKSAGNDEESGSSTPVTNLSECAFIRGAPVEWCILSVWVQSWRNFSQTTIKCNTRPDELVFEGSSNAMRSNIVERRSKRNVDWTLFSEKFKFFAQQYNKKYASHEDAERRYRIFLANHLIIQQLNERELGTAKYGATQFADLTRQEFQKRYLGLKPISHNAFVRQQPGIVVTTKVDLPIEFDWRDHNAVSEVKNQGMCGSCWAFSVTGNVEGQYAIQHETLLSLSEQELIDCDRLDDGCNGGLMDTAYSAIIKLGGLETEQNYRYRAENEKCLFNRRLARVKLQSYVNISSDEDEMAQWLYQNGPISVAINANAMQFYFGGISHPFKFLCNPKNLDHGVLIVGYGVHKYPLFNRTIPYWVVKNSWGKSWGEQGYYRVYRGGGTCGINQTPSSSIVE